METTGITRPRPRIPRIVLLSPVILVVVLLLTWFTLAAIFQGPLAGDTKHDFGVVTVTSPEGVELSHTFHLTNRTNDALLMRFARPDCGCLTVNAEFPMTIFPGESIDLPITMRYRGPEPKTVLFHLDFAEFGKQALRVRASGAK